MLIAAALSLMMPGLGHVFAGFLARALIWFGGLLLIGAILSGGGATPLASLAMFAAVGACSAADAWLVVRMSTRER